MIRAELILDNRRKTKKGYPVKIRVYLKGRYKYLPLKIYQSGPALDMTLELKKRDFELAEQIEYCNQFNLTLDEAFKIIKYGVSADNEIFLLERRLRALKQESSVTLNEFIDHLIVERKSVNKSIDHFIQAQIQFNKFLNNEDIKINDIDYETLNSFIIYKKNQGTGDHGISYYLRTLRTVYREAQKRKSLNIKGGNPFQGLIKSGGRKVIPNISPEELRNLLDIKYNKSTHHHNRISLRRVADLFLFQFAIGGHDYVDIAHLKWENIKNDRVVFQRFKNKNHTGGGPSINNFLNSYALSIIEKYGDTQSERIFSHIPIDGRYKHHRSNVNRSLRTISKTSMPGQKITSKTPRYLFRTFAGYMSIDNLTIMQIQGHSPRGVTFGYQREFSSDHIDQAMAKVNALLFNGGYDNT